MKPRTRAPSPYEVWIKEHYPTTREALGMCDKATREMVEAFPELKRQPGHVYTLGWGKRAHWWCVAPDGSVVDPTAVQYTDAPICEYVAFQPGDEVRIGRCMNCGEDIYAEVEDLTKPLVGKSTTFCSDQCSEEMARDVGW